MTDSAFVTEGPAGAEPLDRDVPCMRCGYNLRTKRAGEVCPECGQPVEESIRAHDENPFPVPDPVRATAAFTLLALGMTAPVVNVGVYELLEGMRFFRMLHVMYVSGAILTWCAVLLLSAAHRRFRVRRSFLRLLQITASAYLLLSIVYFIDSFLPEPARPAWIGPGSPGATALWILEAFGRDVARGAIYIFLALSLGEWARQLRAGWLAWISYATFFLPAGLTAVEAAIDAYRIYFYTCHIGVHLPRWILETIGYTWDIEGICAAAVVASLIWGYFIATRRYPLRPGAIG